MSIAESGHNAAIEQKGDLEVSLSQHHGGYTGLPDLRIGRPEQFGRKHSLDRLNLTGWNR